MAIGTHMVETIEWTPAGVVMIDQTRLPLHEEYVTCRTYEEVADGDSQHGDSRRAGHRRGGGHGGGDWRGARRRQPIWTRRWNVSAIRWRARGPPRSISSGRSTACASCINRCADVRWPRFAIALAAEAQQIRLEDIAINHAIGRHGAGLVPDGKTVLTHCNAGALATAGYGTALGVIRAAVEAGKKVDVFADETRPFLQGARLTVWELQQDHIPATLITDNMAGHFLKSGRIGCVVVGADRIAANGDVANKIGTYSVAVLAKENGVPFFVAAPISTLDLTLASGDLIPIERRPDAEVTHVFGNAVAPAGTPVENPAFDVTPNRYVTAIITERGVARAPYVESLRRLAT